MSWERSAERGPGYFLFKLFFFLIGFGLVAGGLFYVIGWFSEAGQVAREEFGPRAALQKYEWFKDAAAALQAKQASIKVYQARIERVRKEVKSPDRTEREQLMTWEQEVAGLKASYNQDASVYNAQMSKFNYRFANRGELPEGAAEPLPRGFSPYLEE